MMKIKATIGAMAAAATLWAAPASAEVKAVNNFNLNRYLGKWHEIARMPMVFQWGCKNSVAEYGKLPNGKVSVHNTCDRALGRSSIVGDAEVKGTGKLAVSFSKLMPRRANYWVLYVDPAYKFAVVGEPGSRYGWILSRSADITKSQADKALKVLTKNGYNTSRLIWNKTQ